MAAFQLENGILTIENGTEYLESEKFAEETEIVKAVLPEGLRHISVACFTGCINLEEINIPSTVETIDDGAFLFCEKLERIKFPNGLKEIADLSFQGTSLKTVNIPDSCTRIGEEAFFECPELEEINIANPDAMIGDDAFASCYKLLNGFVAPGYPVNETPGSELLYSLLWATCPDRHKEETTARAEKFIRDNEMLVMERIIKYNNIGAMNGISKRHLLRDENIDKYVRTANEEGLTELTALLIKAKGTRKSLEEEFEL